MNCVCPDSLFFFSGRVNAGYPGGYFYRGKISILCINSTRSAAEDETVYRKPYYSLKRSSMPTPTYDITLNLFVFGSMLLLAILVGYLARSRELARKNRTIVKLEMEMVQAHAELLENQREFCELEARMKDITNPVIPINSKSSEDQLQTPLPEQDGLRHLPPAGSR